ncbi:DUF4279 domain-containing protein [Bacillus salipaludis]|uniref:DUF4279 domain-containing protein n=1 Tax=Bacillus salipaludis TaxID=2547811 RepID=UPI003AF31D81
MGRIVGEGFWYSLGEISLLCILGMCLGIGESFVAGSFNFIIRGRDLVPDEITKKLNLKPSSVKKKSELLTKDIKMKDSYWSYKVKFKNNEELNQVLEEF